MNSTQLHLDRLTKPVGSLGRLEELACRLAEIQKVRLPFSSPRHLSLFVGDHGVVQAGVSAWPSSVTSAMITNILDGTAASSVLARKTSTSLTVIDVGSYDQLERVNPGTQSLRYQSRRVALGTRNLAIESAMTMDELGPALRVGEEAASEAILAGNHVLLTGEMGIGNTTSASCLAVAIGGLDVEQAVGRGAGADDATLQRKRSIVRKATARVRSKSMVEQVAELGGFEIVAMAGFFMQAARQQVPVILDGFVATAAALIAEGLLPGVKQILVASHLSAEPAHRYLLKQLGLQPYLEWNMRLGEGTGALLLLPMLDAASAICREMGTLEDLMKRIATGNSGDAQ